MYQVVVRLERRKGGQRRDPCDLQRLRELLRCVVRRPDVSHVSGGDQLAEGGERLVDRRLLIGPVALIQVDGLGPQATEAVLDRAEDVRATQPLTIRTSPHLS